MKVLVVYYSRSGNTRRVAEMLATDLEADIAEIKDLENRQGVTGFLRSGYEATTGKMANIAGLDLDPGAYDLVVIGTPVWAGKMSSPVRAFLSQYGRSIKNVAYIITRADRKNQYLNICAEMDDLLGKRHVAAESLWNRDKSALETIKAFSARLKLD